MIATERETHRLASEFNLGEISGSCVCCSAYSWIMITLELQRQGLDSELPEIYTGTASRLDDDYTCDNHDYLVYKGVVYNNGVTYGAPVWENRSYEFLKGYGEKVTIKRLKMALEDYEQKLRRKKFIEENPELVKQGWGDDGLSLEVVENVAIQKGLSLNDVILRVQKWIRDLEDPNIKGKIDEKPLL